MIGEMHGINLEIHLALFFHISCNASLACQYLTTLASRGVLESVSTLPWCIDDIPCTRPNRSNNTTKFFPYLVR